MKAILDHNNKFNPQFVLSLKYCTIKIQINFDSSDYLDWSENQTMNHYEYLQLNSSQGSCTCLRLKWKPDLKYQGSLEARFSASGNWQCPILPLGREVRNNWWDSAELGLGKSGPYSQYSLFWKFWGLVPYKFCWGLKHLRDSMFLFSWKLELVGPWRKCIQRDNFLKGNVSNSEKKIQFTVNYLSNLLEKSYLGLDWYIGGVVSIPISATNYTCIALGKSFQLLCASGRLSIYPSVLSCCPSPLYLTAFPIKLVVIAMALVAFRPCVIFSYFSRNGIVCIVL